MDKKTLITFDSGNEYGCISIRKQSYIEFDGKKIEIGNERRAFNPSQVEDVKKYAPEIYLIYKAMCTPEVIKRWEDYQKEQQNLGA